MPKKKIRKAFEEYAAQVCKEKGLTDEQVAQKMQEQFDADFKKPTQEELERVEEILGWEPNPNKKGEVDPQDSKYTPLGNEEKERRRALQPKALKAVCTANAIQFNKNVDTSKVSDPRQALSLLPPDHKEEQQQFIDDWANSKGDEKEHAKLLLKAAKWCLEKKDDPMFNKELSDEELVEKYPDIYKYSVVAGELTEAFKENSPLVKYGMISEKDRQRMGREINKMYDVCTKASGRMELLANPLYAEANMDDFMKFSDNGGEQKCDRLGNVGDFGYALGWGGQNLRSIQFESCKKELSSKHGCHFEDCVFFNLNGEQIKDEELENTVRRGDMFLVSDPSREGETEPCMWKKDTGLLTGRDAMDQMQRSENYPKPSLWHRFLNAISPKLLETMYGTDAVEKMQRWQQKEMVAGGRYQGKFGKLLDDTRKQSLEIKPDAKKAREKRAADAEERQKQSLKTRREDMKQRRTELMEKARGERGLDNNLKNMERDCIFEFSEIAVNNQIRTNDDDLPYGEYTPLTQMTGRALFLSHLQDVQQNGTPEQKQMLDDLDREGFEKLYDNYTKTDEFHHVCRDLEGKDMTLVFMMPYEDIETISRVKYKDPGQVGEKESKAFQSLVKFASQERKESLSHRSYIKPFDLKAELGEMAKQKQSEAQKVSGREEPVIGDKPPVVEQPKLN